MSKDSLRCTGLVTDARIDLRRRRGNRRREQKINIPPAPTYAYPIPILLQYHMEYQTHSATSLSSCRGRNRPQLAFAGEKLAVQAKAAQLKTVKGELKLSLCQYPRIGQCEQVWDSSGAQVIGVVLRSSSLSLKPFARIASLST